jgi:hypothetical protein
MVVVFHIPENVLELVAAIEWGTMTDCRFTHYLAVCIATMSGACTVRMK